MAKDTRKKYWLDKEIYSGMPGCDAHESLAEFFADYYGDNTKKHEMQIQLNDVTVTFKRKGY